MCRVELNATRIFEIMLSPDRGEDESLCEASTAPVGIG